MFTAERVAMLMLALAVAAWAAVTWISTKSTAELPPECDTVIDSVTTTIEVVDTSIMKKDATRKKRKSNTARRKRQSVKKQQPPLQRDHLREPVAEE